MFIMDAFLRHIRIDTFEILQARVEVLWENLKMNINVAEVNDFLGSRKVAGISNTRFDTSLIIKGRGVLSTIVESQ